MKHKVTLPLPELRFPEPGWRERFERKVEEAARSGLELHARLARGADEAELARLEKALGLRLPAELRALLAGASGGRIGHLSLVPAGSIGPLTGELRETPPEDLPRGVSASDLVGFARDLTGNVYAAQHAKPLAIPAGERGPAIASGGVASDSAALAWRASEASRASPAATGARHAVVYVGRDPAGTEHRFSSLGRFLDAAFVRAHAAALHRKAEEERGTDLDDEPWLAAARAREQELDPDLLRTRED